MSCLEEDEAAKIDNLFEKLDDQRFDKGRINEFIAAEKLKIENYQKMAEELEEHAQLTSALEAAEQSLAEGKVEIEELTDVIGLTKLELQQTRRVLRKKVRKAAIGKEIDLSSTKGEGYEDVKIMKVSPLALKIYMPSGPETVPLRELPEAVREMLQMSEDEAADYLRRKNESEVARAEEFKKWKEGQSERDEEAAKEALIQRMKDLQEEIYEREDAINIRLQEMKAWKSKASNMELEASRERNDDRARKLERLADLARDKALALSDENSDSWIVVGRLKGELQDLKRIGIR